MSRPSTTLRRLLVGVLLLTILAVAVGLRWQRTDDGLPYIYEWDEPVIASVALDMMKRGSLEPGFYHYGTFTHYLLLGVDVAAFFHLAADHPSLFGVERGDPIEYRRLDLDSIRTVFDHGWLWEVSHPEFYLWNRRAFALLGTLTSVLVFLLARDAARRAWRSSSSLETAETVETMAAVAGLAAAGLLAVSELHVERSSVVNADLTMTFWAVVAAWAASRFVDRRRLGWLALSAVAVGLASASKYTGVLAWILPFLAFLAVRGRSSGSLRRRAWAVLVGLPAAVFLVFNPVIVFDLPSFLAEAGFEVYHYRGLGHAAVDVAPGWDHFLLDLERISGHLGLVPLLLAFVGIAALVRRRVGFGLWLFPAVYATYMAGTLPTFHRNMLVVYPFLAVLAGLGLVWTVRAIVRRVGAADEIAWGVAALVFALLALDAWRTAQRGAFLGRPDTRTRAVEVIAGSASEGVLRVGVAEEVRVHPREVERLRSDPGLGLTVAPHLELLEDADSYDLLLVGESYGRVWPRHVEARRLADRLNDAALPPGETMPITDVAGETTVFLDGRSARPPLLIHRAAPARP